jgi:hypothetical protein
MKLFVSSSDKTTEKGYSEGRKIWQSSGILFLQKTCSYTAVIFLWSEDQSTEDF